MKKHSIKASPTTTVYPQDCGYESAGPERNRSPASHFPTHSALLRPRTTRGLKNTSHWIKSFLFGTHGWLPVVGNNNDKNTQITVLAWANTALISTGLPVSSKQTPESGPSSYQPTLPEFSLAFSHLSLLYDPDPPCLLMFLCFCTSDSFYLKHCLDLFFTWWNMPSVATYSLKTFCNSQNWFFPCHLFI